VRYSVYIHGGILLLDFANKGTKDIFECVSSKESRKTLPVNLHKIAKRKLDQLAYAEEIKDLKWPPGNKLEKLKGDYDGFYSIRINDQWRVVFEWIRSGPKNIEIVDYH